MRGHLMNDDETLENKTTNHETEAVKRNRIGT